MTAPRGERTIKYLNKSMENEHKCTQLKPRHRQGYPSFTTARKTLDGMEAIPMIQKGHIRCVGKDIKNQNKFICGLFFLTAYPAYSPDKICLTNIFPIVRKFQ